jgi:hypothetical protein
MRRLNTLCSFSRRFFASLPGCLCKRILLSLPFRYFGGADPGLCGFGSAARRIE